MKFIAYFLGVCLFAAALSGCAAKPPLPPVEPPGLIPAPLETSKPGVSAGSGLFIETDDIVSVPTAVHVARSRFVRINFDLLLDETGQPRPLEPGHEIEINLFPDVTYTGVIAQTADDGGAYSWLGNLKDIEFSELTMVYTGGIFIGKFASPAGVYEVSIVGEDLYQIILIDQQKFRGTEG